MRLPSFLSALALVALLGTGWAVGACAAGQSSLDPMHAQLYNDCRSYLERQNCHGESDCDQRLWRAYESTRADERTTWLTRHGCPDAKIEHRLDQQALAPTPDDEP